MDTSFSETAGTVHKLGLCRRCTIYVFTGTALCPELQRQLTYIISFAGSMLIVTMVLPIASIKGSCMGTHWLF